MIAFVLSGGAIEVGALQSLLAHHIQPDFVVGTSAGSLNGAYFCAHPDAAGVEQLARIWIDSKREDAFPGNVITWALRVLFGRNGLVSNAALTETVKKHLTSDKSTFGDLTIPLYVTTADLVTAQLIVYGDDTSARLLEPVVASAAFPLVIDPVELEGHQLTDGGVVAYAAIEVAIQRGATEIYAIDLSPLIAKPEPLRGIGNVGLQMLDVALREHLLDDLRDALTAGVTLHHINIPAFSGLSLFDFSQARQMIEAGRAAVDAYLDAPRPNVIQSVVREERESLSPPPGGRFMRWGLKQIS
ncbi:MAG TPA: patatin-like phospholipase family protein [Anaerolineae bacterium]|nr:patatin-like phospholipase family protein [Anaerolineae bacterium]